MEESTTFSREFRDAYDQFPDQLPWQENPRAALLSTLSLWTTWRRIAEQGGRVEWSTGGTGESTRLTH